MNQKEMIQFSEKQLVEKYEECIEQLKEDIKELKEVIISISKP